MSASSEEAEEKNGQANSPVRPPLVDRLRLKASDVQARVEPLLPSYAKYMPLLALGYFAIMALLRLTVSPNLEIDEAQFVGHTGFSLGYDGWHPPLYGWLVTVALWLTFGHWVAALALVKMVLMTAQVFLAWDLVRRLTDDPKKALIAGLSLAFLPQFIWMAQVTLAHSVLVGFATLATLHAIYFWLLKPGWMNSAWLVAAIVSGVLAKYNYIAFLAALSLAVALTPAMRIRVDRRWALGVAGCATALVMPHFLWGFAHLDQTVDMSAKFYRGGANLPFDVPYIGIDGFFQFLLAFFAWAGGLIAIVGLTSGKASWAKLQSGTKAGDLWSFTDGYEQVAWRTIGLGLAFVGLIVLAIDMHRFHERYLTPLLLPLVVLVALWVPFEKRGRTWFVIAATCIALIVPLGVIGSNLFGPLRTQIPYQQIVERLGSFEPDATQILAHRDDEMANIAILVDGAEPVDRLGVAPETKGLIIVWRGQDSSPPERIARRIPERFSPVGEPVGHDYPYRNFSGRRAVFQTQLFADKAVE